MMVHLNLNLYSGTLYQGLFKNDLCGDEGLTTIGTEDECLKAANELCYPYPPNIVFNVETDSKYPSGCYEYEPDQYQPCKVWFNHHRTGSRDHKAGPMCIKL